MITVNKGDFALEERRSVNQSLGNLDFPALILDHMDLQPGLNVLDIACGNGKWTIKFKKRSAPDWWPE
jgi:ubiquinone/menaquinone biosynthesis C-methylase UbiE